MSMDSESRIAERLIAEGLISLCDAAKLMPPSRPRRGGTRHMSAAAILRWVIRGKRGVKLEAIPASGKTWWTSKPALGRFLAAVRERMMEPYRRNDEIETPALLSERERRGAAAVAEFKRISTAGRVSREMANAAIEKLRQERKAKRNGSEGTS